MTEQEHLLVIIAEECAEVAQRATKALRFGLEEIQEGQKLTNSQRLQYEFSDLLGAYDLLSEKHPVSFPTSKQRRSKQSKIKKYLKYSKTIGTLS